MMYRTVLVLSLEDPDRTGRMDSSVALGRLELGSPGARLNGPVPRDRSAQQQSAGTRPRPRGCVPLSHQVAGHKYGVDKVGILQHPDGTVLKQLQPPPRGPRELQFYSMVYAEDCCDPCLLELQKHLPKYYGTWSPPDNPTEIYLNLEDVTRRFRKPCIMDVKLGQRSYDPFASQEKREQQIRKYPLMEQIGFLVLGMRVYQVDFDSFDTYDQHYGRGLVEDTVKNGLSKFFYNGETLRRDAIKASLAKVRNILLWFESQSQLNFYASSLLIVYEGLPVAIEKRSTSQRNREPPECNNNIKSNLSGVYWNGHEDEVTEFREASKVESMEVEVRMIDFAHVFPSQAPDHGYIYGLRNLLKVLQQILDD